MLIGQRRRVVNTLLFRSEVLQARQTPWLGSIRIGRSPGFLGATSLAICFALALISFSIWGEVTRKARLPGILIPAAGVITLSAPQSGTLAEVLVNEGDVVKAGQALMHLKTERNTALGEAAVLHAQALSQRRTSLETERILTQQQYQQRQGSSLDRLSSLQAEERQAQGELATNQLRVQLGTRSESRFAELARSGFVSAIQAQQKLEELLDLQLRERNAERNLESLRREMQTLRAEMHSNQNVSKTSLALIDRNLASLSQESTENEIRSGLTITAPQSGLVNALTLHSGQTVQTGQTLISLFPKGSSLDSQDLEAHLFAPSRTAGFVRAGQSVWLRYAAYPYQKFGMAEGTVSSISQTPIAPQDLPPGQGQALLTAVQANEPLFRISVRLKRQDISTYGRRQSLRAGMALDADVLQDRRAIWEWVLEPVLAARKYWPHGD